MPTRDELAQKQLQDGFALPSEFKLYANAFAAGSSQADVVVVFQKNGEPIAVVNMSYTIAKSLAVKLTDLMKDFEEKVGQTILTTDDIGSAMGVKPDYE